MEIVIWHTLCLKAQNQQNQKGSKLMLNKRFSFVVLLLLFFTAGSLLAQTDASAASDVTITLQKGLSISTGGDLDFGNHVVLTSDNTVSYSTPVNVLVTGEPSKSVDFTFDEAVELSGDGGTLTFNTKLEQTGGSGSYLAGNNVTNSDSETISGDRKSRRRRPRERSVQVGT